MNRRIVWTATLVLCGSQALAVNWVYVTTSATDSDYYIDVDSIRNQSSYASSTKTAWFKVDHARDKTEPARSSKNLYEANCGASELRLNQWIDYKADGSVLKSSTGKTFGSYQVVAPETVGYTVLEAICNPTSLTQ